MHTCIHACKVIWIHIDNFKKVISSRGREKVRKKTEE